MYYTKGDKSRVVEIKRDSNLQEEPYRKPWSRDYARLIHSPSFRRLQGKTQLFPGQESDFFRNRLTHSQEVAQIAKSIAIKLNYDLNKKNQDYKIDPTLADFAGLAHDLGHPPFGHLGERALNKKMINSGGFEGNAQTLRILTKLEKKDIIEGTSSGIDADGIDKRVGLNLTFRSLASILKYDEKIQYSKRSVEDDFDNLKPIKGYYESEENIVKKIKGKVTGIDNYRGEFKTIECRIMDIADDIAYSTFDMEDAFKVGFLEPLDLIAAPDYLIKNIKKKINRNLKQNLNENNIKEIILNIFRDYFPPYPFETGSGVHVSDKEKINLFLSAVGVVKNISKDIASNGYYRAPFTSRLVGRFIRGVEIDKINKKIPALSTLKMDEDILLEIEVLKNFTYESQVLSPKVKIVEYRGEEIVSTIFDTLNDSKGFELLPPDIRIIYDLFKREEDKKRVTSDFIAGMTDSYALEFYSRLKTVNPQTIFKPFY